MAEYTAADNDPNALIERLRLKADRTVRDPESMVAQLQDQMTPPDRRIVDDMSIRRLLHETYTVALTPGPWGWIDDVFALRSSWGFSLGAIQSPVRLWHGADDNFAPASHTRWLAQPDRQRRGRRPAGLRPFRRRGDPAVDPRLVGRHGLERVRIDDASEQPPVLAECRDRGVAGADALGELTNDLR